MLTDRDKMSNHYIEPSIDANYQVLVLFVKRFQRRRLTCEKLTHHRRRMTDDGFRQAVSEEKILEIDQSKTRIGCGGHVC